MIRETCEHAINGTGGPFYDLTDKETGNKSRLCQACMIDFLREDGVDPETDAMGFHIYRSDDPDVPKSQWKRLTERPIPEVKFTDDTGQPGTTFYYYMTSVNIFGIESPPSEVVSGKTKGQAKVN
jgi:hypothetical protein